MIHCGPDQLGAAHNMIEVHDDPAPTRRGRKTAAILTLVLVLAATGIGGTLLLAAVHSDSTQSVYDAITAMRARPESASEVFDGLRAEYKQEQFSDVAVLNVLTEAPVSSSSFQLKEWLAFVCFLADQGDWRAARALENWRVQTREGHVSVAAWLGTSGSREESWIARKDTARLEWSNGVLTVLDE